MTAQDAALVLLRQMDVRTGQPAVRDAEPASPMLNPDPSWAARQIGKRTLYLRRMSLAMGLCASEAEADALSLSQLTAMMDGRS